MEATKRLLIARGLLLSFEDWCKEHKTLLTYGNLPRTAEEYYNEYATEIVVDYWEVYRQIGE
jgi:hypothetical protein